MPFAIRQFFLSTLLFCAVSVSVLAHPPLNGTWTLIPSRSDFAGEPVLQTGTLKIEDREHNIFVSRSFNFDGEHGGFEYSFTTDGRENSTIRDGKQFKSKAKWDHEVLEVRTDNHGLITVERFMLTPDGMLRVTLDRPSHSPQTLFFRRQ